MSSHVIWVRCEKCGTSEGIPTSDVTLDDFDDNDWEGETISTPCRECKNE